MSFFLGSKNEQRKLQKLFTKEQIKKSTSSKEKFANYRKKVFQTLVKWNLK